MLTPLETELLAALKICEGLGPAEDRAQVDAAIAKAEATPRSTTFDQIYDELMSCETKEECAEHAARWLISHVRWLERLKKGDPSAWESQKGLVDGC